MIQPILANAAVYAIENATAEGKTTCAVLVLLSLFSWTVIITKFRQLLIARRATRKFMAAYASTRDPLVRMTSCVRVDLLNVYLQRRMARGPSVRYSLDWSVKRPAGRSR